MGKENRCPDNAEKLRNVTALVTGGSRGVGRGIALGLGEYGATVYITGRNKNDLDETSRQVKALGGECIPLLCDHNIDNDTIKAFETIRNSGRSLSMLINCAWGGYEEMSEKGSFTWVNKFWNQSLKRWDRAFNIGVRTIFLNSKLAMNLMDSEKKGMIVNISFWAAQKYVGNIIYGASKAATDKLTSDMVKELDSSKISVISLYPGMVRTEEVMKFAQYLDMSNSESPQFIGRVISQMYLDPNYKLKSGKVCIAAALALEYDVTDIDGKQPRPLSIDEL